MIDVDVRRAAYDLTIRSGAPPLASDVAQHLGASVDDIRVSFVRLRDAHVLVLQESGEILMLPPFSAVPTPFRVTCKGVEFYANCVWDALGVPAMLHGDAHISTSCGDCGSAVEIDVVDDVVKGGGFIHFAVPARQWWNDIVFT